MSDTPKTDASVTEITVYTTLHGGHVQQSTSTMVPADFARELERRVAALESGYGYICAGCGLRRPPNYYIYEARNPETKEVVRPLCAPCIRDGFSRLADKPWQHAGPFKQAI